MSGGIRVPPDRTVAVLLAAARFAVYKVYRAGALAKAGDRAAASGRTLHRRRLWDWNDTQLARCWHAGPSPQDVNLFHASAYRTPNR